MADLVPYGSTAGDRSRVRCLSSIAGRKREDSASGRCIDLDTAECMRREALFNAAQAKQ